MKNIIFLSLIIPIFTFSCKQYDFSFEEFNCVDASDDYFDNSCKNDWECSFELLENSTINNDDENPKIESGDQLVFKVRLDHPGVDIIADDEFLYELYFELDPTLTSFSAEDEELEGLKTWFNLSCFCYPSGWLEIKKGCIQGEKNENGEWEVHANILYEDPSELIEIAKIVAIF